MLINKALQQDCELFILLHSPDLREIMQCVKGMLIAVIYPLDVWVVDDYVWQELQVHQPSGKPLRQLQSA